MTNTLAAKIVKASHEVGALATDKKNPQGNYDYISADKILDRAGDALANNGLSLIPSIISAMTEAYQTGPNSKPYWCAHVAMVMTLSDGETTLEYPWHGMGTDYTVADKAFFKAITGGHKYFLMKLLNIGVGNEDGEHDAPPAEANSAKPAPPPAAPRKEATKPTTPPAAATTERTATGNASTNSGGAGNGNGKPATNSNGNGHSKPANGNGGDVFKIRYPAAKEAARKSGKFGAESHLDAAWSKLFVEYKAGDPANADTFLAAWEKYVAEHEPAKERKPADVPSMADAPAIPDGVPA